MVKKGTSKNATAEQCGGSSVGSAHSTPTRARGTQESGSAPLSNTAPANYTKLANGTTILRAGTDSLYLSYAGSLLDFYEQTLEELKILAQSEEVESRAEAYFLLVDHSFEVLGKGRGRFPFVLTDNWFHLQLSRAQSQKLPLAYVQVSSELLTRSGVPNVVTTLNNVVKVLAGKVIHPTVSRVDLCVDFVTEENLEAIPQCHWITRACDQSRYYDERRFSGFTFGHRSVMSCRLYNKSIEIKKSKKNYLIPLWQAAGWDGEADVWRLEFQFNRTVLNEFRVDSVPDLQAQMNSLWCYATHAWLQLKRPLADDQNKTRWPLYSLWQELSKVPFNQHPVEPLLRTRKARVPSDDYLYQAGLGPITSFMAREGIEDVEEALNKFHHGAERYYRDNYGQKSEVLKTYVRKKINQKRTRYNLQKPEKPTKAQAYRRNKGKGV